STYGHRTRKTRHPVRSAIYKPCIGAVVVEWVTISECVLLYVFDFLLHWRYDRYLPSFFFLNCKRMAALDR
ncbi:hypothetical protein M501DRAFT_924341, partial [Patellaria atrata CBS 101060]